MSEDNTRISFRKDKLPESLKFNKNKFGHTVTSENSDESEPNVELTMAGYTIEAHVDIFESPHLQKFIAENNFNLQEEIDNKIEDIEIDLGDEIQKLNTQQQRPNTLEEFDQIAEKFIGESRFKKPQKESNTKNTNHFDFKPCFNCKSKIKADAKFCSECGTPQAVANFCKNCGIKYEGNEKFCSECGTKRQ